MNNSRGFSLVELSIVLVILGLLVGGVLSGQSLIRASELRSVVSQYQRYYAATTAFRDKYFAFPGDMTTAATFWGAADGAGGTTAACATTAGTGTQTCNGNGDGFVALSTSSNENFRFWQHLANAGLIEGNYDGITHGTTTYSATTANVPVGRISATGWFMNNWASSSGFAFNAQYAGIYANFFEFGAFTANADPVGPIFKPEEAWNIDTKLDDGMPATGHVVIRATGGLATCTDSAVGTTFTANYLLSASTPTCSLIFRQMF